MQIGEYERVAHILHVEVVAQGLLAERLESIERVLVRRGEQQVGHLVHAARFARVNEAYDLGHHVRLHVLHNHHVALALQHLVLEHGVEHNTSSLYIDIIDVNANAHTNVEFTHSSAQWNG